MNQRVGLGYDLHKLVKGRKLILGGVNIPFDYGLDGHSDADVLIHAIIDAILGALALQDIGRHFPPDDIKYKNIDSTILLGKVLQLLSNENYKISNLDSVLILERPKMADHIDAIRKNLAEKMGLEINQISVKAKTNEKCGLIGDEKAIAAQAIVLLYK